MSSRRDLEGKGGPYGHLKPRISRE